MNRTSREKQIGMKHSSNIEPCLIAPLPINFYPRFLYLFDNSKKVLHPEKIAISYIGQCFGIVDLKNGYFTQESHLLQLQPPKINIKMRFQNKNSF